jgi:conjugative relaxase-like TrwC/TraI family protein
MAGPSGEVVMLRVTTLYASTAAVTAGYYTAYLTEAEGEIPGRWTGKQAALHGLVGEVNGEQLELVLSGRHPQTGATLGFPLVDRTMTDGRVVRAVSGFDATVSAPKSLSVWWAITGDQRLLEAHDIAVNAVIGSLEKYGATTRIRRDGGRLHPDAQGLTIAAFRQTTSRLDDPQIHSHVVISAKVQVDNGSWYALDARMLKKHQRALGGIYQSVLRAELTERFGVRFGEIVKGQADVLGVPDELLDVFSKRAAEVATALDSKLEKFGRREGREPSPFERAAMEREAAVDTRGRKTGMTVTDLRPRWHAEAKDLGITPQSLTRTIQAAGRQVEPPQPLTVGDALTVLAERSSVWHRMDVLEALTDTLRPKPQIGGLRWAEVLDRTADRVLGLSVNLDPTLDEHARRRASDGRSIWIEPIAAHHTSTAVLAQEELILTWALDHQQTDPQPSTTVQAGRLDLLQHDAARAVAGLDRLVIIVGPAGTGKTTMLTAAAVDLKAHGRNVYAVAPTAKAARTLATETGMTADTVAKLVYEWTQPGRPARPEWRLPAETTLIVDEAGMLGTNDLHHLTMLAETQRWRLILVGDPRQLQAVGRGGMFNELANNSHTHQLDTIHRFNHPWEAAASLQLRQGDQSVLDVYEAQGRIIPGSLDQHLDAITRLYGDAQATGHTMAITTTTNEHVVLVNAAIQKHLIARGVVDPTISAIGAGGQRVHVGDQIATRANQRQLKTSTGDIVRNRELWTVTGITDTGDIGARRVGGTDIVTLPAAYVAEHVHLGYAATEHGNQSDTRHASLTLITPTTTGRGLYVAMTRGRETNMAYVITGEPTLDAARQVLEGVMASDRADVPAVVQRRQLAAQTAARPAAPVLRPRCTIPEWLTPIQQRAITEFARIETAFDAIEARKAGELNKVTDADRALTAARTALAPHNLACRQANSDLAAAQTAVTIAKANVGEHRLLGRRPARQQLTAAETALAAAQQRVEDANTARYPYLQTFGQAEQRRDAIMESARTRDVLDRYEYLPQQHTKTVDLLNALDTWRDWAAGRPVRPDRITSAVETLESPGQHPDRQSFKALAEAIRTRTPELVITRTAPAVELARQPEFDLGIDL